MFIFLPCLEGDAWVKEDQIVGIYRHAHSARTEVHLMNGEIALTDLSPRKIFDRLYQLEDPTVYV